MPRSVYRALGESKLVEVVPPGGGTPLEIIQNLAAQEPSNLSLKIMERACIANLVLPIKMATLVRLFKEAVEPHFEWKPSGPGSDGAGVLDGTVTSGECKFLANALFTLLTAPAPYGFELVADDKLCVETYDGIRQGGFVSTHVGVHYSLRANVMNPTNQSRIGMYFWGDHKVVRYNNRYWDVCYNTSYARLSDMASFVCGNDELVNDRVVFTAYKNGLRRYFMMNNDPQYAWCTALGPYVTKPTPVASAIHQPAVVQQRRDWCNIL